jgi:putative lipoic acid-binding regulatory protein
MMCEIRLPELIFPCKYPIKVFGKNEDDFIEFVYGIVSKHVPDLSINDLTTHSSGGGKYQSVSVTFIAESRTQVDALYQELGQYPRVLVAM